MIQAAYWAAVRKLTSNADALSALTATSGRATVATASPTWLMVEADQYRQKLAEARAGSAPSGVACSVSGPVC